MPGDDDGVEYLPLYEMNADKLDEDDPLNPGPLENGFPGKTHRRLSRTASKVVIALIVALVIILVGLLITPTPRDRHHFWDDIFGGGEREGASIENPGYTAYGRTLQDWQLDTSREYHLTAGGRQWNFEEEPTTREYHFIISEIEAAPNGVAKLMTVVNGKFPGPLIEASEGDRIKVHVENKGSKPTALHFHGMHQNGTNYMDGATGITQCPIQPGGKFTYDFTVQGQWGTYWYHSHYSTQYVEGFAGPMVIHSKKEKELIEPYDEDVVIFLSDLYHDSSYELTKKYIAPNVENQEPIPDSGLIQGVNYFDCSKFGNDGNKKCGDSDRAVIPVDTAKAYRFRLISAGAFSEFDFSIDNHILTVIEADGTNTEPLETEVVRLSNAQRYSVVVKTKNEEDGSFWMRANMNTFCYDGENPNLDPSLRAVFSYPRNTEEIKQNKGVVPKERQPKTSQSHQLDGTISCKELDPSLLVPAIPMQAPPADRFIAIDASFQIGARQISFAYLNDTTYNATPQNPTFAKIKECATTGNSTILSPESVNPQWANANLVVTIDKPQVIDLLINNYDDGAHPFHLHGYKVWEIAHGQGYYEPGMYATFNTTNPIRRDTVQVTKFGWSLLRFVADVPGVWMFHCHIIWHTEAGMVLQFSINPEQLINQSPPDDWNQLCQV